MRTDERKNLTKEISHIQAQILKELLVDGRKTAAEIAEENGIKREVIYRNFQEMKQIGIIKGATIHINYRGFGYKAVANLLINIDPAQADQLMEYIRKMQDIYALYSYGPKGNIRVVATLKTLQQLDQVKDAIKRNFSILNMKTVIWTDVKEMNENLSIVQQKATAKVGMTPADLKSQKTKPTLREKTEIDETNLKIAEILSKDGLAPFSKIAKETGISNTQVKKRYQGLKRNGLLKVTTQIDPTKIGYRAMAVFYITFTMHDDSFSTIEKISRIPDVISIMKTSGDFDLQVYVLIRDIDQLLSIQDAFADMAGIAKTELDLTKILKKWPTPRQYISTF